MKCFPFLLTKEPLDVIGAVQCPGAGSVLRHSLQWICKLENLLHPRPIQKQNSNSRSNIDTKIFKSKYFIKSLLENCFLVRKKLPTIFVNVKKVLFHWKGFFNLPHLAQESIKEQAWAKKLKQWRKKGDLKHILCRKPLFDRLENFLPSQRPKPSWSAVNEYLRCSVPTFTQRGFLLRSFFIILGDVPIFVRCR